MSIEHSSTTAIGGFAVTITFQAPSSGDPARDAARLQACTQVLPLLVDEAAASLQAAAVEADVNSRARRGGWSPTVLEGGR